MTYYPFRVAVDSGLVLHADPVRAGQAGGDPAVQHSAPAVPRLTLTVRDVSQVRLLAVSAAEGGPAKAVFLS